MRALLLTGLTLLAPSLILAQRPAWQPPPGRATLPLWPAGAPGATAALPPEKDMTTAKDNLIAGRGLVRLGNVSTPTLTVYTPKGANSGAAVVVFPGGGYQILAIDLEGTEVCDWLTGIGVTCVLVKYRVPDSGPIPQSSAALQDAQRAMGLVRQHAKAWGIDPARVGVLGFSAGGHLSAAISTHFDQRAYARVDAADELPCRPDFAVLVYPAYLVQPDRQMAPNADITPTRQTPPTFIVQSEDDPVHVENATSYFVQLKQAGVPAELHLYAEGGHGYGLRRTAMPVTRWPALVEGWMRTMRVVGKR